MRIEAASFPISGSPQRPSFIMFEGLSKESVAEYRHLNGLIPLNLHHCALAFSWEARSHSGRVNASRSMSYWILSEGFQFRVSFQFVINGHDRGKKDQNAFAMR
jgi:hypothetical protein